MRAAAPALGLILLACARQLVATDAPPPAAPSTAEDRLMFSASGATLTGGSGGGGLSALWAHTFAPRDVIIVGAEYEQIADAHWTNGVVSGSLGLGGGAYGTTLYADAHEGSGDQAARGFHYSVETVGLLQSLTEPVTLQLEGRRIDVDTSHGTLGKLGLSLHVARPWLVSASYMDTLSGNLGTYLTTVRVDYAGHALNGLAGAVGGQAAPAVLDLLGQVVRPSAKLREFFAGVGRSFGRADWQLLADYQDLEDIKRTTVTLSCTLHLDGHGHPP